MSNQIVEMFADIVSRVESKVLPALQAIDANIETIHYEHGHYSEIDTTLRQFDKSGSFYNKKYPLIALFEDIKESVSDDTSIANLTLIICYSSKTEYKSEDRYQSVINPILEPIYNELVSQIKSFPYFRGYQFPHNKIIRPYWGVEGKYGNRANVFSDYLDAIELNGLKIKYEQNYCKPENSKIWQR